MPIVPNKIWLKIEYKYYVVFLSNGIQMNIREKIGIFLERFTFRHVIFQLSYPLFFYLDDSRSIALFRVDKIESR